MRTLQMNPQMNHDLAFGRYCNLGSAPIGNYLGTSSLRNNAGGTGLGLSATCDSYVERHRAAHPSVYGRHTPMTTAPHGAYANTSVYGQSHISPHIQTANNMPNPATTAAYPYSENDRSASPSRIATGRSQLYGNLPASVALSFMPLHQKAS